MTFGSEISCFNYCNNNINNSCNISLAVYSLYYEVINQKISYLTLARAVSVVFQPIHFQVQNYHFLALKDNLQSRNI